MAFHGKTQTSAIIVSFIAVAIALVHTQGKMIIPMMLAIVAASARVRAIVWVLGEWTQVLPFSIATPM